MSVENVLGVGSAAHGSVALLIFGGSRGARHLNEVMLSLYKRLKDVPNVKVFHVAGPLEVESVTAALKGDNSLLRVKREGGHDAAGAEGTAA